MASHQRFWFNTKRCLEFKIYLVSITLLLFLAPKEHDKNKTQNLIDNLLAFSGEGNKSNRSHRKKIVGEWYFD